MPRITLSGVVFEHAAGVPFPTPLDLELEPGWTGVVGPNGAGKTTLLRLIFGELRPSAGELRRPRGLVASRVPQTVDGSPGELERLRHFAADWSKGAAILRGQLELDEAILERWPAASPGERKRWQLAAALARSPTLLLCDEPTNHLDARSRQLIVAALRRHEGIGVIVSHERELLEQLCESLVFVDPGGRVELRRARYGDALRERQREREHLRDRHAFAQRHERAARRKLDAARRRVARTERSKRSSSRKKNPRDHDASSAARKHRAAHAAASADASLRRQISAHARALAEVGSLSPTRELGGELFVDWEAPRKRELLRLAPADLPRVAPGPWTRLPGQVRELVVARDDRIHIAGQNGAGKTSLLRALRARAHEQLPAERIVWLEQEHDEASRRALSSSLRTLDRSERGRVLQIVARCGVDPARVLASPSLSPGEARKLALALGLARRAWLLVLDEPTHHLDLPAVEAIEAMLADYPGALVFTSHDPHFCAGLRARSMTLDE